MFVDIKRDRYALFCCVPDLWRTDRRTHGQPKT